MAKQNECKSMEELTSLMLRISEASPVYRRIAAYIEQEYMQVIFMTAENLAEVLGISQGSVSKFCIAMGYRGYSDFLRSLQRLVSRDFSAPRRYHYTAASQHHTEDVIAKETLNIRSLKEITALPEYEKLVECVAGKQELVLLSARMSATLLPYTKYILDKLRDGVFLVTPGSDWDLVSLHHHPETTGIIAVGLPRYPRVLTEKMAELKKAGFYIHAVTDSRFSPLCAHADNVVLIPTTVASIFDIYSTPIMFLNLLVSDAARKMPGLEERLAKIEQLEKEENAYIG